MKIFLIIFQNNILKFPLEIKSALKKEHQYEHRLTPHVNIYILYLLIIFTLNINI